MRVPALKFILAVSSATALAKLNGSTLLVSAAQVVREFAREVGQKSEISVAVASDLAPQVSKVLMQAGIEFSLLDCDPNNPRDFATALAANLNIFDHFEIIVIHDSNRPLTKLSQFHRTLAALLAGGVAECEAARSSAAFTETLKSVTKDAIVEYTIDRSTIRRIATPEMIRITAIEFDENAESQPSGWFVPLKSGARINYVESDPESIRVDSEEEIKLLESLQHCQQSVAQ